MDALEQLFSFARPLVAAALLARDPAAIVPFNRGSLHAAALSWADGHATCADANCGVGLVPTTISIVAVVAVPPDLNIDALGHLDALGLARSDERGSRQHRCNCRHGKSDFHHVGILLGLDLGGTTGAKAEGFQRGANLACKQRGAYGPISQVGSAQIST